MNLTRIIYFFKKKRKIVETYTFKRVEHELIILKKLEDDKIFYNGTIYEKDFFHYHKLAHSLQFIFDFRDDFIRTELNNQYKIRYKLGEYIPNIFNPEDIISGKILEVNLLLFWQYDILVKAYKYEFCYPLDYDLFQRAKTLDIHDSYFDKKLSGEMNFYDNIEAPDLIYGGMLKYEKPLLNTFFKDWFYTFGWKAIKRVYPIFEIPTFLHYKDYLRTDEPDFFRNSYTYLDQGTHLRNINKDWIIEYDEQKKFDEFDINCKTNSYYTRYKAYNEIYNKDYPEEKKFKTDLFYSDFTEDEIKANYEAMIDKEKKAIDKWNFVMQNGKNKEAVDNLFMKLERYEAAQKKPEYPDSWREDRHDHDMDNHESLFYEIENVLYDILNDPRNILVMPLLDIYFEIFRPKGWYNQDESFYLFYHNEKKLYKHIKYYDMSYERQYMLVKKEWLVYDYLDVEDEEIEEHYEEEYGDMLIALFLFTWFSILTCYSVIYLWTFLHTPLNVVRFTEDLFASYEFFRNKGGSRIYYGFELKAPRLKYHSLKPNLRLPFRRRVFPKRYIFPAKIYKEVNYNYVRRRTFLKQSSAVLLWISKELNKADFGLEKFDLRLRYFGYDYQIYRFRVMWVEEPMPRKLQLFIPKIVDFCTGLVMKLSSFLVEQKNQYRTRQIENMKISLRDFKYSSIAIRDRKFEDKKELAKVFGYGGADTTLNTIDYFRTTKCKKFRRVIKTMIMEPKISNRRRIRNRQELVKLVSKSQSERIFRLFDVRLDRYRKKLEIRREAAVYVNEVYEIGPRPRTYERLRQNFYQAREAGYEAVSATKALARAELRAAKTAAAVEPARAAIEPAKAAAKAAAEEYEKVEYGANEAIRAKKKAVKAELAAIKAEKNAVKAAEDAVKAAEALKKAKIRYEEAKAFEAYAKKQRRNNHGF